MKLLNLSRLALAAAAAVAFAGLGGCVAYPNYAGQPYQNTGGYVQTPPTYQAGYNGYNAYPGDSGGYGGQPTSQRPYYGQYNTYDGYGRGYYQPQQQAYGYQQPSPCSSLNAGTLLGAAGGGLIGSTIGKGKGQLAGVAAGALLGGLTGNSVQNNMSGCR